MVPSPEKYLVKEQVQTTYMRAMGPCMLAICVLGIIAGSYAVDEYNNSYLDDKAKPANQSAYKANITLLALFSGFAILAIAATIVAWKRNRLTDKEIAETAGKMMTKMMAHGQ